jgi:hypothetical protein
MKAYMNKNMVNVLYFQIQSNLLFDIISIWHFNFIELDNNIKLNVIMKFTFHSIANLL